MSEVRIAAEPRSEFGKGAARRIRRADKVPAVLYGHGQEPRHIALPGHELMLALKTPNVLLALDLEGGTELALPRDVQRDPVRGYLEHVDLVMVVRGEKVTVDIPVEVVGEVPAGGLLNQDHTTIQLEAEATALPDAVRVDVSTLEVGAHVTAGDLQLPAGSSLAADPETLVLSITAAPSAEEVEADLAESESELGIVHDLKTDETEGAAEAPAES